MKAKLFIFYFFAVLATVARAQSVGELHNQALAAIISKFENIPVNFDSVYNFASKYASEKKISFLSYNRTKSIASDYIVGKNSDQMWSAAKANNLVSNSLSTYIDRVISEIDRAPDASPNSVSARLNSLVTSTEYSNLSTADKKLASDYNDVFGKSYQFWYGLNASRKCGIKCHACIAAVDAFWTIATGGNWVIGALMSAVSRCCGCGDCGPRVNCL